MLDSNTTYSRLYNITHFDQKYNKFLPLVSYKNIFWQFWLLL